MPDLDSIYTSMADLKDLKQAELRELSREDILELRIKAFNAQASASQLLESVKQECRAEIRRRVMTASSDLELQKELPQVFQSEAEMMLGEAASRYNPENEEFLAELYDNTDFSMYPGKVGGVFHD